MVLLVLCISLLLPLNHASDEFSCFKLNQSEKLSVLTYPDQSEHPIKIPDLPWTSGQINAHVANILLREIMRYSTELVTIRSYDSDAIVSLVSGCQNTTGCSCSKHSEGNSIEVSQQSQLQLSLQKANYPIIHVTLETWSSGIKRALCLPVHSRPFLASVLQYVGDDSYFLWRETVETALNSTKQLSLDYFRSYDIQKFEPHLFFDPWQELLQSLPVDVIVRCSTVAGRNSWDNRYRQNLIGDPDAECFNDMVWFSPSCRLNNTRCVPLMIQHSFDRTMQLAQVSHFLHFPLAVVMVERGRNNYAEYYRAVSAGNFLFGYKTPDDQLVDSKGRLPLLLTLPRWISGEQRMPTFETSAASQQLHSYLWRELPAIDAQISRFLSQMELLDEDMAALMRRTSALKAAGAESPDATRRAACEWLKGNPARWRSWIAPACPVGQYSDAALNACTACPQGAYCPGGRRPTSTCPQGSYCPDASVYPTPCPLGTSTPGPGSVDEASCVMCAAGYLRMAAGGACIPTSEALPAVAIPTSMLACLMAAAVVWRRLSARKRGATPAGRVLGGVDLAYSDPLEVIGRGHDSVVVLANLSGTPVAVKCFQTSETWGGGFIAGTPTPVYSVESESVDAVATHRDDDVEASSADPNANFLLAGTGVGGGGNAVGELQEGLFTGTAPPDRNVKLRVVNIVDAPEEHPPPRNQGIRRMAVALKQLVLGRRPGGASPSVSARMCQHRHGGRLCHQVLPSDHPSESSSDRRRREASLLCLAGMRHPSIVAVLGLAPAPPGHRGLCLAMELMELGSLWDLLHSRVFAIDAELALQTLQSVARGLRFLHGAVPPLLHTDLKSPNVLLDRHFTAKLSDVCPPDRAGGQPLGTLAWMAPECLRGFSNTTASDIYSFGVIVHEVLTLRPPYECDTPGDQLAAIECGRGSLLLPAGCSAEMAAIMRECLRPDPVHRPPATEVDRRIATWEAAAVLRTSSSSSSSSSSLRSIHVPSGEGLRRWCNPRIDAERCPMHESLPANACDSVVNPQHEAQRGPDQSHATDRLIRDMFPQHVAEALLRGERVPPEPKEMVTMFFSDVVGFTVLSGSMPPEAVSDMLDRLYLRLDALAEEHGVHKLETIGDAYLCATNIAAPQHDHAVRMARFAVAAIQAAAETPIDPADPARGSVQIRAGLHSGPCMAGVIGRRQPKYTLFGDTINVASRMESSSHPGRAQCSDRTAALVRAQDPAGQVVLVPRGSVEIKGKGSMETWWMDVQSNDGCS
jgi:class 3 adenylate cyclase